MKPEKEPKPPKEHKDPNPHKPAKAKAGDAPVTPSLRFHITKFGRMPP